MSKNNFLELNLSKSFTEETGSALAYILDKTYSNDNLERLKSLNISGTKTDKVSSKKIFESLSKSK